MKLKMSAVHWIALGMFLSGLATQMSSLPSWSAATNPVFIAGVIMNLGSVIVAAASGKIFPPERRATDPANFNRSTDIVG